MMLGPIILIIVLFYFWNNQGHKYDVKNNLDHHCESALDILKERFARGEISSEEFQERKSVLKQ